MEYDHHVERYSDPEQRYTPGWLSRIKKAVGIEATTRSETVTSPVRPDVSGEEPWRNPGTLVSIPSDDARVAPLPPGTRTGNVSEMAEGFEEFHRSMVELAKNPEESRQTARDFINGWDMEAFRRDTLQVLVERAAAEEQRDNQAVEAGTPAADASHGAGVISGETTPTNNTLQSGAS